MSLSLQRVSVPEAQTPRIDVVKAVAGNILERRMRRVDAAVDDADNDTFAARMDRRSGNTAIPHRFAADPSRAGIGHQLALEIRRNRLDAVDALEGTCLCLCQRDGKAVADEVIAVLRRQLSAKTRFCTREDLILTRLQIGGVTLDCLRLCIESQVACDFDRCRLQSGGAFSGTQLTHVLERCSGWISQGHEIDGARVLVHGRVGHVPDGRSGAGRGQQGKEQHAG